MVSCKRKSHHLLARRKQPGKSLLPSNNDGQQEPLASDSSEFPVNTINRRGTGDAGLDQDECSIFSEVRHTGTAVITTLHVPFLDIIIRCNLFFQLSRDHETMIEVLSGRKLRLKVSSTLWHRNVGELLAYFLRLK